MVSSLLRFPGDVFADFDELHRQLDRVPLHQPAVGGSVFEFGRKAAWWLAVLHLLAILFIPIGPGSFQRQPDETGGAGQRLTSNWGRGPR